MIAVLKFMLPNEAHELDDAKNGTKHRVRAEKMEKLIREFDKYIGAALGGQSSEAMQLLDEIQMKWSELKLESLS